MWFNQRTHGNCQSATVNLESSQKQAFYLRELIMEFSFTFVFHHLRTSTGEKSRALRERRAGRGFRAQGQTRNRGKTFGLSHEKSHQLRWRTLKSRSFTLFQWRATCFCNWAERKMRDIKLSNFLHSWCGGRPARNLQIQISTFYHMNLLRSTAGPAEAVALLSHTHRRHRKWTMVKM